jgi:hypothetical protein
MPKSTFPDEFVHIREPERGATCDVHSWPDEGMGVRLVAEMRAKHGKSGVNVCHTCLKRAHASTRANRTSEEPPELEEER